MEVEFLKNEISFKTTKTARVFTLGELNESTKSVWFVLHGYGELAEKFIEQFKSLAEDGHFIIAPEALSKFYWNGFSGKPVASWMTKIDRKNEIRDYVDYLEALRIDLLKDFPQVDINLLGFSQGVATVCRWFAFSAFKARNLFLFGSVLPHDLNYVELKSRFESVNITLAIGKNDPFFNEERKEQGLKLMENSKIDYEFILFDGKHEVQVNIIQDQLN